MWRVWLFVRRVQFFLFLFLRREEKNIFLIFKMTLNTYFILIINDDATGVKVRYCQAENKEAAYKLIHEKHSVKCNAVVISRAEAKTIINRLKYGMNDELVAYEFHKL